MKGNKVIVIGGGIIGLSTAYYLLKEGYRVTVLDKGDITSGASFVNAGFITPSHIVPLAAPGMIAKGIKMMFNSASPFYMKPRWDADFFNWAYKFHKSSTKKKVESAIPVIKDINVLSKDLYSELKSSGDIGHFQFEKKGLLMLYQTEEAHNHEYLVAKKAEDLGLEVSYLNKMELQKLEPDVEILADGAIHYECDAHTTPTQVMPKLLAYLKNEGVEIKTGTKVVSVVSSGDKIKEIVTSSGAFKADEFVLAAGAWSGELAKLLSIQLPLQGGKGYRINLKKPTGITIPSILMEAKMAVTPMEGFTRFAGTMEFSGNNDKIRKERVLALTEGAKKYYPNIEIGKEEISKAQTGLRPVSPDGLPYIGKGSKISNLTFATGHAMMGWSLGPATGKLVSEIITGRPTSMDVSPFHPDRKFK